MSPELTDHLAQTFLEESSRLELMLREGDIPPAKFEDVHERLCRHCRVLMHTGLPTPLSAKAYDAVDASAHLFAVAMQTREIGS